MDKNTELLGKFKGKLYSITRKVKPAFNNVESFSVSIHFNDPEVMRQIEVVRIDNSHGFVHMDKLFTENSEKERMPNMNAFSAYDYLKDNWKDFARKYDG